MSNFKGKRILVTGACGTVGSELIHQLVNNQSYVADEIIGLDNNESGLFFLDQKYINNENVRLYVADIRDRDELNRRMSGVDIVFHAAALKHVVLCERSPDQAVQSNIIGIQNVISAAFDNSVERVIFTSSDKAVNPTNVMGTSKLMGERLMTAANSYNSTSGPVFTSTRFGNVLGSNGSVVPIFHKQIAEGNAITITDKEMTRFVMSIEQSVRLVIDSAGLAQGGEVFITKMPVVKICDLAEAMKRILAPHYGHDPENIEMIEIGVKPGEKLYEELMNLEETRRAIELPDYFSVTPAFRDVYQGIKYDYPDIVSEEIDNPYISSDEPHLSVDEIISFIDQHGILGSLMSNRGQS